MRKRRALRQARGVVSATWQSGVEGQQKGKSLRGSGLPPCEAFVLRVYYRDGNKSASKPGQGRRAPAGHRLRQLGHQYALAAAMRRRPAAAAGPGHPAAAPRGGGPRRLGQQPAGLPPSSCTRPPAPHRSRSAKIARRAGTAAAPGLRHPGPGRGRPQRPPAGGFFARVGEAVMGMPPRCADFLEFLGDVTFPSGASSWGAPACACGTSWKPCTNAACAPCPSSPSPACCSARSWPLWARCS